MPLKLKCILLLVLSILNATAQDTIRLKSYLGNLKQIEVLIDGNPYHFLFDTCGGETFLSPDIAKAIGKKP